MLCTELGFFMSLVDAWLTVCRPDDLGREKKNLPDVRRATCDVLRATC